MSSATACPANIGRTQRLLRWSFAAAMAVVWGVLLGWFLVSGQPWYVRLTLAIPAWFAFLNLLQARRQVCVFLAAQGRMHLDGGVQPVSDPEADRLLRRQSRRILWQTTLLAAGVTLLTLPLPSWA
jgi:hypothetical protein